MRRNSSGRRESSTASLHSANLNCYLNNAANCFAQQSFDELSAHTFEMTNAQQWNGNGMPPNFACNGTLNRLPVRVLLRHLSRHGSASKVANSRMFCRDVTNLARRMRPQPFESRVGTKADWVAVEVDEDFRAVARRQRDVIPAVAVSVGDGE